MSEKSLKTKFHEIPSSGTRVVQCGMRGGRRDGYNGVKSNFFLNFAKCTAVGCKDIVADEYIVRSCSALVLTLYCTFKYDLYVLKCMCSCIVWGVSNQYVLYDVWAIPS